MITDNFTEDIQKAILVGLQLGNRTELPIEDSMDELAELARAAGAEVYGQIVQNKATIEAATYIGKGKAEEVAQMVSIEGANLVIFNDELSGAQIRNLEAVIDCRVIDRTALILDIFAQRAKTNIARLQVELAQLKYALPRLTGLGVSLSRTGGGIGTRGPGEQKLEIDRRRIRERISDIGKQLDEEKKNRETQRAKRKRSEMPIVALVGYTNAGKSTVMNRMIDSSIDPSEDKRVFEKDMLFATLDTYHRRISLEDRKDFILIDTVGFVSKLPHALVQAFKATLEEVSEADLLLQVVDTSNVHYENQMSVTEQVLKELDVKDRKMIMLYNKVDLISRTVIYDKSLDYLTISAKYGDGFDTLMERLKQELFGKWKKVRLLIPYHNGEVNSQIHEQYTVLRSEYQNEGILIEAELDEVGMGKYNAYISKDGQFENESL